MPSFAKCCSCSFVGSAITALTTPWSGAELRGKIASGFVRAEKAAATEVEKVTNTVKEAEATVADGAHTLVANAKTAIADGRDSLADAIREPKKADGHVAARS